MENLVCVDSPVRGHIILKTLAIRNCFSRSIGIYLTDGQMTTTYTPATCMDRRHDVDIAEKTATVK